MRGGLRPELPCARRLRCAVREIFDMRSELRPRSTARGADARRLRRGTSTAASRAQGRRRRFPSRPSAPPASPLARRPAPARDAGAGEARTVTQSSPDGGEHTASFKRAEPHRSQSLTCGVIEFPSASSTEARVSAQILALTATRAGASTESALAAARASRAGGPWTPSIATRNSRTTPTLRPSRRPLSAAPRSSPARCAEGDWQAARLWRGPSRVAEARSDSGAAPRRARLAREASKRRFATCRPSSTGLL